MSKRRWGHPDCGETPVSRLSELGLVMDQRRVVYGGFFPTDLDWIGVQWSNQGVRRLTFGHASADAAEGGLRSASKLAMTRREVSPVLRRQLCDYAAGHLVDFHRVRLDLVDLTDFQRRVLSACRQIAYGTTLTYAQLAQRAHAPTAARAVGQVMARNPVPLIIPCHRVVARAGGLGGFSAPRGLTMKRRLLRLEGAQIAPAGYLS